MGEHLLLVGTGGHWPPQPPWHGPFGGLVDLGTGLLTETAIGEFPWDSFWFPIGHWNEEAVPDVASSNRLVDLLVADMT